MKRYRLNCEGRKCAPTQRRRHSFGRITAAFLVAVWMLELIAPMAAMARPANTAKQEVVYINLNADGSLDNLCVVNIFDLNEDGQIIDYGDYTRLRNMTSNDEIRFEDQTVRIDTKAGKLYYEGELNRNVIPWDFSLRYALDGREYSAQELAGRSGEVEIVLSIRQNPDCDSSFFNSFALQATFLFDTGRFTNIVAADATVANVSSNKQLSYTLLPGKETDIAMTASVRDFRMESIAINALPIGMEIDVEAQDTSDLDEELDSLTDAIDELDEGAHELLDGAIELRDGAAELVDGVTELQDGVTELYDGSIELKDGAIELTDGVIELQDGVTELYDGAVEMKEGVDELLDGATELKDGAVELYDGVLELRDGGDDLYEGSMELRDGALELKDGASDLNDGIGEAADGVRKLYNGAGDLRDGADALYRGASELHSGLATLSGQSDTLVSGAYTVFEQLTVQATEQLNASLAAMGMERVNLTPSNYDAVIDNLLNALSSGAYAQAEAAAVATIRAQVEAAFLAQIEQSLRTNGEALAQIEEGVENAYAVEIESSSQHYLAVEMARAMQPDDPEAWLQTPEGQMAVATYLASEEGQAALAAARIQIKAQYIEAAIGQTVTAQMNAPEIQEQINAAVQGALADGQTQSQINDAVNSGLGGNAAYRGVLALKNQLAQYQSFYDGLRQYTAGVGSAAGGAYRLQAGAAALDDGSRELRSGATTLRDGLKELQDGSQELLDGTATLYDGTTELYDGVTSLQEGIGELLDGSLALKDGTFELYDGVIELQDGTVKLYDGVVELKDGVIELLDGAIELKDGTVELYDGVIELKDGVIELLDGAIEMHEGTLELCDGTIELTDGTFEFKDKTAHLDQDLKDRINEAIDEMLGKDVALISFVSEENTNIESVQFVIKTPLIERTAETHVEEVAVVQLTWWQKLLRLFGWYS